MWAFPALASRSPAPSRSTLEPFAAFVRQNAMRRGGMPNFFGNTRANLRAILAIISLGLTLSACGYNTIPTLQETAKARWADVQNQYQRRADLIPNLVATVQGYA